jgi:hypothetical protein
VTCKFFSVFVYTNRNQSEHTSVAGNQAGGNKNGRMKHTIKTDSSSNAVDAWHALGEKNEVVKDAIRVGEVAGLGKVIVTRTGRYVTLLNPAERWEGIVAETVIALVKDLVEGR